MGIYHRDFLSQSLVRLLQKILREEYRRNDWWLVQTVGVLVTVIGASYRHDSEADTIMLAAGSALGLAGIDVVNVSKRNVGPVYLLDMIAELLLANAWKELWPAPKQENRG